MATTKDGKIINTDSAATSAVAQSPGMQTVQRAAGSQTAPKNTITVATGTSPTYLVTEQQKAAVARKMTEGKTAGTMTTAAQAATPAVTAGTQTTGRDYYSTVPYGQYAREQKKAALSRQNNATTYIDEHGDKKAGVVGASSTQTPTLYADAANGTGNGYYDESGKYRTTIYGADGKTYDGYIYNGAAYYANGNRLNVGDYVYGEGGQKYEMTPEKASGVNPDLSNAKSDAWQEWAGSDAGLNSSARITNDYAGYKDQYRTDAYGQDAANGNIQQWADGTIAVYDGHQNYMGSFDTAGTWHPNGEGTAGRDTDPLFSSWEKTARNYLDNAGYKFTGNGSEWKAGEEYNYYNVNRRDHISMADHYSQTAGLPGKSYYDELGIAGGGSGGTAQSGTYNYGTGTQQRDMMAGETARQQQIQQQIDQQRQQQQAQIAAMTPEDNAQMAQLRDQLAQVDVLLEQARASNDEAYALQLEQLRNRIQLQIDGLNEQYQAANRQLYIDYMNGRRDLPQQLAAMGYTGGLRESSLLGLQNNYEGQLAENERARLAGIREIESGGIDKELTLGIENIKDNAAQAEKAYDRSAAIKAQMLSQLNRIEDLNREDSQQARKEAQAQIDVFLSAGGNAAEIPAALLNISGYSGSYVTQLSNQYRQQQAREQADAIVRAGGTVPSDIAAMAGYATSYTGALDQAAQRTRAQQQIQQILSAGGTVPDSLAQAAGYGLDYTAALGSAQSQREARDQITQILSAGGTVPYALAQAAGYSTDYINALMSAQQQSTARAQADAILKAGGTVSDDLAQAAGYNTDYINALNALNAPTAVKPVLTVAQVNDAIKNGILSDQVLAAYEYYYGTPYQQAAQPTYYDPGIYQPPKSPEPIPQPTTEELEAQYRQALNYAGAGIAGTQAETREEIASAIGADLANKVSAKELSRDEAIAIMQRLGIA